MTGGRACAAKLEPKRHSKDSKADKTTSPNNAGNSVLPGSGGRQT